MYKHWMTGRWAGTLIEFLFAHMLFIKRFAIRLLVHTVDMNENEKYMESHMVRLLLWLYEGSDTRGEIVFTDWSDVRRISSTT